MSPNAVASGRSDEKLRDHFLTFGIASADAVEDAMPISKVGLDSAEVVDTNNVTNRVPVYYLEHMWFFAWRAVSRNGETRPFDEWCEHVESVDMDEADPVPLDRPPTTGE